MRILYDILFFFFALLYLPRFLKKGKHRKGFSERFGIVPAAARAVLRGKQVIWIHAVSVGEIVQAIRMAGLLREQWPDAQFLFTTTTGTGRETADRLKRDEDVLLYFPADFRFAVRSFIRSTRPVAVILMETEIWPNLIFELDRRRIPVVIMNGRISDKALPSYRKIRFFLRRVLNRFSAIGVQDEGMRARFLELGAEGTALRVTGNVKFDWHPSPRQEVAAADLGRLKKEGQFLLIAGSTHEGEEEALFDLFQALRPKHPSLRLLLAPRHPERIPAIESLAARKKVRLEKISVMISENSDAVWLLDRMGVLAALYRLADLVFVGGSLVPVGGHNPVEPAFFEKPVLFGPFMHNFKEMAEAFKRENAALQVTDAAVLERVVDSLISDAARRRALGSAAKNLLRRHEGAAQKNIEMLLEVLESRDV